MYGQSEALLADNKLQLALEFGRCGKVKRFSLRLSFRAFLRERETTARIIPGVGELKADEEGTLGTIPIRLEVDDARGGTATQDYRIRLWPDLENAPPAIASTAPEKIGLNQDVYRYQVAALDPDGDTLTYRLIEAPLGALLDRETGELVWLPDGIVAGETYRFAIEVTDGKGT